MNAGGTPTLSTRDHPDCMNRLQPGINHDHHPGRNFDGSCSKMESIISNLLTRFEKGSLCRRELVQGFAMPAAAGRLPPPRKMSISVATIWQARARWRIGKLLSRGHDDGSGARGLPCLMTGAAGPLGISLLRLNICRLTLKPCLPAGLRCRFVHVRRTFGRFAEVPSTCS